MQADHTVCTYAPPHHQRWSLLNWALITRWKWRGTPFSLARRTRRLWFPTRTSNLDSSEHWTLFNFETHYKWALSHRTRRRFWTMFTYDLFLHDRALVGVCRWHDGLCLLTGWFLEVFLSPFSNVNDRILPMSDAVSSEGLKTRSLPLSLTHRYFTSFSGSSDDVMHCRWWN